MLIKFKLQIYLQKICIFFVTLCWNGVYHKFPSPLCLYSWHILQRLVSYTKKALRLFSQFLIFCQQVKFGIFKISRFRVTCYMFFVIWKEFFLKFSVDLWIFFVLWETEGNRRCWIFISLLAVKLKTTILVATTEERTWWKARRDRDSE